MWQAKMLCVLFYLKISGRHSIKIDNTYFQLDINNRVTILNGGHTDETMGYSTRFRS